LRKYYQICKV